MRNVILIIAIYLGILIRSKEAWFNVIIEDWFNAIIVVLSVLLLLLCGLEFTIGCMMGVLSGIYLRSIRDVIVEMIKEDM